MDLRARLSDLIISFAATSERHLVLSGDHGYMLFDGIRSKHPTQFINGGIMEQAMVGIAAGLARTGFRPIVYGLSAFIPMRVLEQIKLDVCYSKLPVLFLGDGAGLVYSTLGASHQCGEDLAALRALPYLKIFSPADAFELEACFQEAMTYEGPAYIRIGKSDRPAVNQATRTGTAPYQTRKSASGKKIALVSTGSMLSLAHAIANENDLSCVSVPRLKPLDADIKSLLSGFDQLIVIEEHNRYGGLTSAVTDHLCEVGARLPRIHALTLRDQFGHRCGSWQFALSEHALDDRTVRERVAQILSL